MIWLGALLLVAVPIAILSMLARDEAHAERTRPPMAWVRRLWRGSVRNRRQHPRHRASIPLTYRVLPSRGAGLPAITPGGGSPGAAPSDAVTRDLSLGGVGILLSEKLLPGTEVELRLQCAPPAGTITVRGAVRWVREMPPVPGEPRRLFWAGLQLMPSAAITEAQLRAVLEQLSTQDGGGPHAG